MIELGNFRHGHKLAAHAGTMLGPTDVVFSRTDEGGHLLGGVIFTDYTKRTIGLHAAGFTKHWMNTDFIWVTFNYPFKQLCVEAILCEVKESNSEGLAFCRRMGFKDFVIVPEVYPEGDLIVLRMCKDNCPWLKLKPRTLKVGH